MFLEVRERVVFASVPDFLIVGPHCDCTATLPLKEPPIQKQDAGSLRGLLNFHHKREPQPQVSRLTH